MLKINFDKIRPVFGGKLTQPQVDGIKAIIAGWNRWAGGFIDNRQMLAYVLATTTWETGRTMQPVKETGTASNPLPSDATVTARLDKAFAAGKLTWVKTPYWRDGWFGRGLVQLTHETNYDGKLREAVLLAFKVDIHKDRDAVLRMDIAVFILVWGMINGVFTGRKLSNYIDDKDEPDAEDKREFVAARRIINGTDRANEIAVLALAYEASLSAAETKSIPTAPTSAPVTKPRRPTILDWFRSRKMAEPGELVTVEVHSGWVDKVNWTMVIGLLFTVATWFGVPVSEELKVQLIALGNSAVYVVGWVISNFFSGKVTTGSVKNK